MKRISKRLIQKAPGVSSMIQRLNYITKQLESIQGKLAEIQGDVGNHDTRLDHLKRILAEVEHYQPAYHVSGVIDNPARDSLDRCRAIESYLGKVPGTYLLDIGASLGYVCYYFTDRGAVCEGWEYNPKNTEAARLIGEINGIATAVKTKSLDDETVKTIQPGDFDVVTILNVFHHTIHYNGLEYTQKLVKELIERVPVMIVELAKKGEDPKLFWDKAQPKDELAIFDLVKDKVNITKIGDFSNHLSDKFRPLYAVTSKEKTVAINGRTYQYDKKSNEAYSKSIVAYSKLKRHYYFALNYIIKEYEFTKYDDNENLKQIVSEISTLLQVKDIHNMPKLIDFELTTRGARVVVERIEGDLLVDRLMLTNNPRIIAKEVLKSLSDLEKQGLYHNDVRSWNIIYTDKKVSLIDYGFVSHKNSDNDLNALLWVLYAVLTGEREGTHTGKTDLPPKDAFKSDHSLLKLYERVMSGETSPSKASAVFSKNN